MAGGTKDCAPALRVGARAASALLTAISGGTAHAAPPEIQVYDDELAAPRRFGLDLHANDVVTGAARASGDAGKQTVQFMPELSYGIMPQWEVGVAISTVQTTGGSLATQGFKLRAKYLAPHPADQRWYWGGNLEVSRDRSANAPSPWNAEWKAILGGRHGRWDAAFNVNVSVPLTRAQSTPATIEAVSNIDYRLVTRLSLGVESYNGLGSFSRSAGAAQEDHSTFLVANIDLGRWGLNLGAGRGYAGNDDGWIIKSILSVPLGRRPTAARARP